MPLSCARWALGSSAAVARDSSLSTLEKKASDMLLSGHHSDELGSEAKDQAW